MPSTTPRNSSELRVRDFGPIAEATINLRPLTVFVGPSNTGKSFLAILIYAMNRLFSSSRGFARYKYRLFESYPEITTPVRNLISSQDISILLNWVRGLATVEQSIPNQSHRILPEPVAEIIRKHLRGLSRSSDVIESEFKRCFGIDSLSDIIRKSAENHTTITLQSSADRCLEQHRSFQYSIKINRDGNVQFQPVIPSKTPLGYAGDIEPILRRLIDLVPIEGEKSKRNHVDYYSSRLIRDLVDATLAYTLSSASSPAHYLPADRTGIMHAHQVVVGALVMRSTTGAIRPQPQLPMLSGVLADFLETLLQLGGRRGRPRRRSRGAILATRLEESVLGGTVRRDDSSAINFPYPTFRYRPRGWAESLPLTLASSMVSELAPVVLYLRHIVRPGDLLIIEEPESHLHPAIQVEFTKILTAAVRAGVRIIVTTHSEWILEALANLMRISELPETERRIFDVGHSSLPKDMVGAWLFNRDQEQRGSIVKEVALDDEVGAFAVGYDDVALALHNELAEVSSRLQANRIR